MSTSTQPQQQQQKQQQQQQQQQPQGQQGQQGQGQQIPIHESSNQNQNQNQRTMQSNRNQNQNQNDNQHQRTMQSNRNMNRNMNRRNRNYNYNDDMFDSPIERVFKSFLGDDYDNMSLMNRNNNNMGLSMGLNTPSFRANMIEKPNEYQVHADLPGMNKQDMNITFKEGTLEIEGKRESKVDEWDEKHQVHHKEVEYGTFYRSFYLPKSQNVNIKDVKAQYNNGVLNVHVPKDKQQDTQQYRVNVE
jgi:HSP20 family protein